METPNFFGDLRLETFNTNCLFQAAAIVLETGMWPDNYFNVSSKEKPLVVLHWDRIPETTIADLSAGKIRVEPIQYRAVFFKLKDKIFEIIDGEKKR